MKLLTFDSQHLNVGWISFNIQGLTDPKKIASNLSKYFTPQMYLVLGFMVLKKGIRFLSVNIRDLKVTDKNEL